MEGSGIIPHRDHLRANANHDGVRQPGVAGAEVHAVLEKNGRASGPGHSTRACVDQFSGKWISSLGSSEVFDIEPTGIDAEARRGDSAVKGH